MVNDESPKSPKLREALSRLLPTASDKFKTPELTLPLAGNDEFGDWS